jgi:hypothetical protein
MVISRIMSGSPKTKTAMKYGMRYAPPPFCPRTAENRQMLPIPTAAPIAARINPMCDDQRSMKNGSFYGLFNVFSFLIETL